MLILWTWILATYAAFSNCLLTHIPQNAFQNSDFPDNSFQITDEYYYQSLKNGLKYYFHNILNILKYELWSIV